MSVHPSGTGSSWDESSPDVDQPHGLDYRSLQDIRKGVSKRINKQHVDFADSTVGGEHVRGGCSVLDIADTTTDISAKDGTYVGGGIIYSKAANSLWCFTTLTEYTTSDNAYEMKFAPRSICRGADWTWTGIHQFDASIDTTALCVQGSFCVAGTVTCASFVDITRQLTCYSAAYFTNDVTCKADLNVDGTLSVKGNFCISGGGVCDISGTMNVSGKAVFSSDVSNAQFAKAWAALNPSGATVLAGYNIASVAKEGIGDYSITFTSALSTANYAAIITVRDGSANDIGGGLVAASVCQKTTGMRFTTGQSNEVSNSDVTGVSIVIYCA